MFFSFIRHKYSTEGLVLKFFFRFFFLHATKSLILEFSIRGVIFIHSWKCLIFHLSNWVIPYYYTTEGLVLKFSFGFILVEHTQGLILQMLWRIIFMHSTKGLIFKFNIRKVIL